MGDAVRKKLAEAVATETQNVDAARAQVDAARRLQGEAIERRDAALLALADYEGRRREPDQIGFSTFRLRAGVIHISSLYIKNRPEEVMSVMSRCVVLRAEHLLYTDQMEYLVLSPDLPILKEYADPPSYDVICKDGKFLRFDPIPPRPAP